MVFEKNWVVRILSCQTIISWISEACFGVGRICFATEENMQLGSVRLYVLTTYRGQLPHNHESMSLQRYKGLALFDKNNSWWITAGVITDQVLFNIVQLVFKVQIQIYKRENWNIIHGQNKKCYCISIKAWWYTNCSCLFVFYKNRFFSRGVYAWWSMP